MKIAVGIATFDRRDILKETLNCLSTQTRPPDRILVSSPSVEYVDLAHAKSLGIELLITNPGLCTQRNVILCSLTNEDIIVFFDDDFIPAPDYVESVEKLFSMKSDIVVATGIVLQDGINGVDISLGYSLSLIANDQNKNQSLVVDVYNGYGCNMAMRMDIIRKHNLSFDERLCLYGWLEDIDFTRQFRHFGRIVKAGILRGVHRGVKIGRNSSAKLGYSQVINPLYIASKNNCNYFYAIKRIIKNIAMNCYGSLLGDNEIDRRGRLHGNLRGIVDILCGKVHPESIVEYFNDKTY